MSAQPARSTKEMEHCTKFETDMINNLTCPDCNASQSFMNGPTGGLCINIACASCGSEFNVMGAFGIDRISTRGKPNPDRLLSAYRITLPTKDEVQC